MSLWNRYLRWRFDWPRTVAEKHLTLTEYTITHSDGEETTVEAHGYGQTPQFLKFYVVNDVRLGDFGYLRANKETVGRHDDIRHLESEEIEEQSWEAIQDDPAESAEVVRAMGEADAC